MEKGVLVNESIHKKKSVLLLIMLVLSLFFSVEVFALQITPQNIVLEDFSSTQEQVITIINNQFEPIACDMSLNYLSSYLEEYIVFEPERFILQPGEQKNVKAISSFPKDLSPQVHKVIIHTSKTDSANSTITFHPSGTKRSELVVANVDENSSAEGDIIVSLELKNEGNTILFVTPTLEIQQNGQLVKEIVYPQPLILQAGESYPLTLRQDTSELSEGNYVILVRALYDDNEEEFFSESHELAYTVVRRVEEKNDSTQGRNILFGLILGAFGTIAIIWLRPKSNSRKKYVEQKEHKLSNVHDIKHEIHHIKMEISSLTKEVSAVVDRAEQLKKEGKK